MTNLLPRITSAQRNPPPPPIRHPPSSFPLPLTPDLGCQSGGDEEMSQEQGTKKSVARANWNHQRIVYLIGLLKDHDVPRFRTNNAWTKEAWKDITAQFNKKFSTMYSMAQVKQKEQDMKKDYRVVKDLSAESGFGWDSDRNMVTAPDSVWQSLEARRNKESLLRWRDKSFPYYDDLFALYDGRYAEGRSCRGMDHYANKAKQSVEVEGSYSPSFHVPDLQMHSSAPTAPGMCASSLNFETEEGGNGDDTNWFVAEEFSQFSTQVNDPTFLESVEGAQELPSANQFPEEPHRNTRPTSSTPQVPDKRQQKKQKTSSTTSTNDFQEKYLKLKQEEIERFAAIEEKKLDDPYSINNCVRIVEEMAELLQIEEMIKAADIFKDNPRNREVFLSFSRVEIRLAWLREQLKLT